MKYTELSDKAKYVGYIKGTYAEVFNAKGEKICSLQKAQLEKSPAVMAVEIRLDHVHSGVRNIPVILTNEAIKVIGKNMHNPTDVNKMYTNTIVYVKHSAFDWEKIEETEVPSVVTPDRPIIDGKKPEGKTNWLLLAGAAALAYSILKK